jgi:GDA1/CD39 (nucleoside phosphatase) family
LAGKKFCGEDWMTLKERYSTTDEEELPQYCFSSAYIVAFLHDSLGIPMDATRYSSFINYLFFEDIKVSLLQIINQHTLETRKDQTTFCSWRKELEDNLVIECIYSYILLMLQLIHHGMFTHLYRYNHENRCSCVASFQIKKINKQINK